MNVWISWKEVFNGNFQFFNGKFEFLNAFWCICSLLQLNCDSYLYMFMSTLQLFWCFVASIASTFMRTWHTYGLLNSHSSISFPHSMRTPLQHWWMLIHYSYNSLINFSYSSFVLIKIWYFPTNITRYSFWCLIWYCFYLGNCYRVTTLCC